MSKKSRCNSLIKFLFYFAVLLFLFLLRSANSNSLQKYKSSKIHNLNGKVSKIANIPANYSIHQPPPDEIPTNLEFSVLVLNIRDINEVSEELSIEMNLRIFWKDSRLGYWLDELEHNEDYLILNPILIDKIWHPDIFIDRLKDISQQVLISKPASLRLYEDFTFRYSTRISVVLSCSMQFKYYPADTQTCFVDFLSYAYNDKILHLTWRQEEDEGEKAGLLDTIILHNFDVSIETTQNFKVESSSGNYSGIRFAIILKRKISYHMIQTYIPSTLLILVSWLSFLVPVESIPGRIALTMMTLLTLTAMFSSVRQSTPNVTYVKALDIWMVFSIFMVFLTLLEYAILLKLKGKKPKFIKKKKGQSQNKAKKISKNEGKTNVIFDDNEPTLAYYNSQKGQIELEKIRTIEEMQQEIKATNNKVQQGDSIPILNSEISKTRNKYEICIKRIERMTWVFIPTLFFGFNFFYWPWLFQNSEYFLFF